MNEKNIKTNLIKSFYEDVKAKSGEGLIEEVDYWDSDLNAIGIQSKSIKGNIAYVAIEKNMYFVELEKKSTNNSELPYEVVKTIDNLNKQEALEIVLKYLEVN